MSMNPQIQRQASLAPAALLLSSTYFPIFLSVLLFYPELFAARPVHRFLLALVPFWWAYLSARWYIHMAEKSSPLYHPLGCLAHCCVWVFHWVVVLYHALFVTTYTISTYLTTVFCLGIVIVEEWLFHSLITVSSSDAANLGTYEKVRKMYAQGLIIWVRLWYLVDARIPQQQNEDRVRRPMQSRSMTM